MIEIFKISLIAYMFYALTKPKMLFAYYGALLDFLPDYLSWPLGKCYQCFTGQVCLWYYLFTKEFHLVELLFFVSAGIFFAMVFNRVYTYLNDF